MYEHNYIGLSEPMSGFPRDDERNEGLNLKATELRLGLPGSVTPERVADGAWGPGKGFGMLKNLSVSGAKRGFFDAIDNSERWVFPGGALSEADAAKGSALSLSNGGGSESKAQQLPEAMKEALPLSPAPEKKPHGGAGAANGHGFAPSAKAQIVGWPPIRSFRKNSMASSHPKSNEDAESKLACVYVKVSMDGAPYLRKVDLKNYGSYAELSSALEKMFSCFTIGQCSSHGVPAQDGLSESCLKDILHSSEYVLTFEDKDGDWMLVGDVPWEMFTDSCKRLRIMKSSEAIGLAPRAMEESKNR